MAIVRPLSFPLDISLIDWSVFAGAAVLLVVHAWIGATISRREGGLLHASECERHPAQR